MPSYVSPLRHWPRTHAPQLGAVAAIAMTAMLVAADSSAQQAISQPTKQDQQRIDVATGRAGNAVAQGQVQPEPAPDRPADTRATEAPRPPPSNSGSAKQETDPAVAIVGSHIIRESDVRRAMGALSLGDQIDVRSRRARFIDSLVREELLFQSALRAAKSNRAMRDRLKSAIVGNVIQQDIRAKATVTEQQARDYYEATKSNLGGEHIYLRDIRFRDEQTCRAQHNLIKTVEDFARVARTHHVLRDLGLDGGEVGTVMTRHVVFGYGAKLKGLAENEAHLILHDGNCHVVWITDREDHPVPAFEELRDRLIAGLRAGAEAELVQELIAQARKQIAVTRFTKTEEEEVSAQNTNVSSARPNAPADPAPATTADSDSQSVASSASEPATQSQQTAKATVAATESAPAPGTWQLTDHNGKTVTGKSLNGKPAIMTFGFTYCPDVCPTTLMEMTNWIGLLGENAQKLSWSFVSVDPERDTPEVLKSYLENFSDDILGLTGTPEQLASLVKKYGVTVRRVTTNDSDYTMDHSSFVLLLDKAGNIVERIAYGTSADDAVKKIREHVQSLKNKVVKG